MQSNLHRLKKTLVLKIIKYEIILTFFYFFFNTFYAYFFEFLNSIQSSIIIFNTATTGTAKNIPRTPQYAPPTVTANITSNGLISYEFPIILGFIMFESICCNIITTIAIINV